MPQAACALMKLQTHIGKKSIHQPSRLRAEATTSSAAWASSSNIPYRWVLRLWIILTQNLEHLSPHQLWAWVSRCCWSR